MVYGVINLLIGLSLLVWPLIALTTFFIFDAPGSQENPITILFASSIWLYPIPTIIGLVGYLINWKKKKPKKLLRNFTLISLIGPIAITISVILLEVINDGRFV